MGNVLVLEDEAVTQALYVRLLGRMGCRFEMASTLEDARRRMASNGPHDLLVTDLRLPDGRGTDIIGEFRDRNPRGRVLIVTGSPVFPPLDAEPEGRGAEWLDKPFELDDFTGAVQRLLSAAA